MLRSEPENRNCESRSGFTLIEIIIAIMILAVMSLMSFFCFHMVVQSWRQGMETTDAMGQADYVIDQVTSGLKSAYYPDTGRQMDAYGLQFENEGDGADARDTLSWVKVGRALVGEECSFAESPHRVQLYVADGTGRKNEGGGLTVKAWRVDLHLDDFDPEEEVEPLLLSPRVMGMDCRVLDKDQPRKNDEPNWQDEWSFSNSIPRAVELTLYMSPVEKGAEPLEVKRIIEIPMSDLSINPRTQGQQQGNRPGQQPQRQSQRQPQRNPQRTPRRRRPLKMIRIQHPASKSKRGSALIVALWTLMLLGVLVMSFALDAMLEGKISVYVRQRQRVNHLTQSGVAIAEMLLIKQQSVSGSSRATEEEDRWKEPALRIKRGQTTIIDEPIGDGAVRVEIIPEQARWNINQLCNEARAGVPYDLVWEQIFMKSGIPEDLFEELIDCWNDWTDADSTVTGRSGAEDEYYKSLEPPYTARNGPIDTIDELRLVKSFVPAILDGGVLNPEEKKEERQIRVSGIKELFTTYGDGKINVNAAPMEVLSTIPGVDELIAGAIIEEREGAVGSGVLSGSRTVSSASRSATSSGGVGEEEDFSFKSVNDFMSRIPGIDSGVQQYITVNSGTFRLNIRGEAAGISHTIQAIVEVESDKVRYLRWREDP